MKKNMFIFLILALMLFAVGCKTTTTTTGGKIFAGGTNGLDIGFVTNEPPDKVADAGQESFEITLNLKNMGEFTIPKGKIIATLSGIPQDVFSLASMDKISDSFSIEGIQKEDSKEIKGGEEQLSFNAKYKTDIGRDSVRTIQSDVCYYYETDALANVCLKKNPLKKEKEQQACIITTVLNIENSGAPVQVTNVNQKGMGENEVKLTFDIEKKKSTGNVYENDAFSTTCSGQYDKKNNLRVKVTAEEQKNLEIKCSTMDDKSEGVVKLIDGIKSVSCRIKTANLQESVFTTPIEINLAYFYHETLSKDITIEKGE